MTGCQPNKHETFEAFLAELCDAYTREQFEADRTRLLARLCAKYHITEPEVDVLIKEHRYVHSTEDPEQEYIEIMSLAIDAGWARGIISE